LDRMEWLPTTFPQSPVAVDLYVFLAVAPLFAWQLFRTGRIHKAYLIWLAGIVATGFVIYMLWNTPWWHATAPRLVGA
ncbi:MAG: hypothetical protein ACXU8U_12795, partial [Asticcacaulis sp.]